MPRSERKSDGLHSGLPQPIERIVLKRYKASAASRLGAAVTLRAIGVLLRDHPKAALDMAGASLVQAGRSGFEEVKRAVLPSGHDEKPDARDDLDEVQKGKPKAP